MLVCLLPSGGWESEGLCHRRQRRTAWISKPAFHHRRARGNRLPSSRSESDHHLREELWIENSACLSSRIRLQEVASTQCKRSIRTWARGAASHITYRYVFSSVCLKMLCFLPDVGVSSGFKIQAFVAIPVNFTTEWIYFLFCPYSIFTAEKKHLF